jgi:2-succinyl-6-hydroxy-2,4-cyclohexadiene-1-carboxylate synthase
MGQGTQPSLWDTLPALEIPVLLIAGGLDEKYTHLAHTMADRLSNARVEIVPDTGHAVHLEAPGTVARLLEDWLG